MTSPNLSEKDLETMKEKRFNFLKSCFATFEKAVATRRNGATNNYEDAWCIEDFLHHVITCHFRNVDYIREELIDSTHLIDRHKVAACSLFYIMQSLPVHYKNAALDQDENERRLLNAQFALYVAVEILAKWHKKHDHKFSVSKRAEKFIRENRTWLASAFSIPIHLMAHVIYLLEELCVVELDYSIYSCVNENADAKCNRIREPVVREYITPVLRRR